MSKQLVKNYTYNTAAKTVTLSDFTTVSLERLQLITNVTTNQIIYNFADSTVATATVSGNVITLSAAPGSNTDKLMVIYDAASGDPTYDGYRELAGLTAGALNADLVPSTDVSGYKWLSLQYITTTASLSLSFQGSNDGTNWQAVNAYSTTSTLGSAIQTVGIGNAQNLIYGVPIYFKYFRARVTAYTSGSITGTAELYTQSPSGMSTESRVSQNGTWAMGSNSATGSAVPANAFYMGLTNGANLGGLSALTSGGGDGTSGGSVLSVGGMSMFNGTTYDRTRAATSAAGTTGTGVPAAGMLGFDGTNYQRVKTETSGALAGYGATSSTSPATALYAGMSGSSGNLFGLRATGGVGDGSGIDGHLVVAPYLYNGSSFDRNRGNWNTNTADTGAKTASFTGITQSNYNSQGATVVFLIGTVSGTTPTLTAQLQGSSDGTNWFNIPGAVTPSITATGTYTLTVYPGITATANSTVSFPLPRTWRVNYTIGGTTPSFTITNVQVCYTT